VIIVENWGEVGGYLRLFFTKKGVTKGVKKKEKTPIPLG